VFAGIAICPEYLESVPELLVVENPFLTGNL
jgi:hypothetical protein